MGLGHLPPQTRHSNMGAAVIFNNTWGHLAPEKNTSYKGLVRFVMTDHSHYGCQPIIIFYEFPNLEGPYIHDFLFDKICDIETKHFEQGAVYEMLVTFRNYRLYWGKARKVLDAPRLV